MNHERTRAMLKNEIEAVDRYRAALVKSLECLERLASSPKLPLKSTRGRKFMAQEERLVVSERMRKYHESRRQKAQQDRESAERNMQALLSSVIIT